jgi:hypothetical protein
LQGPQKYTQIGIFGMKTNRLATLGRKVFCLFSIQIKVSHQSQLPIFLYLQNVCFPFPEN